MSNFFDNALNDLDKLQEEVLGPDYQYFKFIKTPDQLDMSEDGGAIATNLGALISYGKLLASGDSNASTTGQPLGDKFFMRTGAKCKDVATGQQVTRSLYINNVPDGSIPFISSMLGTDFKEFRGIVPGIISDLGDLNPLAIFQAFMMGSLPDCKSITMPTIDSNNVHSTDTQFLAVPDIRSMNACWFPDGKNPETGQNCSETFQNIDGDKQKKKTANMPDDLLIQLFYGSMGLLGLYILMKLVTKKQ